MLMTLEKNICNYAHPALKSATAAHLSQIKQHTELRRHKYENSISTKDK